MTDEFGAKGSAAETWYYARGGQKYGPFTLAQLRQMTDSGVLTADDMLLDGRSGHWLSAGTAEGVFAAPGVGHPNNRSEPASVPEPVVPLVIPIPQAAVQGTNPSEATRSPADLVLACLALASVAVWLLQLGGVWQVAAGLIWVGFGLRAAATGRMVDFSGWWRRSPWYRPGGVVVALLGAFLVAEGLNARPRVARPVAPGGPRKADRPVRPAADGDTPKPPREGEP